jgi:hypothetical protein
MEFGSVGPHKLHSLLNVFDSLSDPGGINDGTTRRQLSRQSVTNRKPSEPGIG